MPVPARVSLVTLGVADVARSTAFYQALGWQPSAASGDQIAFFKTAGGLLAVFGAEDLAADANLPTSQQGGFRGVSVSINVDSQREVDQALQAAQAAGATLLKPGTMAEFGVYSGYFADPDGHAWEVAWNPHFPIAADERPTLP
ncbi:MAG TPA: VOC family protein [Actinomycetes bacterium]|jgi:predicted lactoylglutathione lyase|nr:VOC family protein [Actinomycetes bacterium]